MENTPNYNTDDNNIRFIIESSLAKLEKANVRLWVVVIILILALIATNTCWIVYENSFEEVSVTQEVDATADGDSDLNIRTIGGVYHVSESESDTDNND